MRGHYYKSKLIFVPKHAKIRYLGIEMYRLWKTVKREILEFLTTYIYHKMHYNPIIIIFNIIGIMINSVS